MMSVCRSVFFFVALVLCLLPATTLGHDAGVADASMSGCPSLGESCGDDGAACGPDADGCMVMTDGDRICTCSCDRDRDCGPEGSCVSFQGDSWCFPDHPDRRNSECDATNCDAGTCTDADPAPDTGSSPDTVPADATPSVSVTGSSDPSRGCTTSPGRPVPFPAVLLAAFFPLARRPTPNA